jgi:hypothetical protein
MRRDFVAGYRGGMADSSAGAAGRADARLRQSRGKGISGLTQGLAKLRWINGGNVRIDTRWADRLIEVDC